MKGRGIALSLLLCAVMGAYFLRLYARPAASTVPLTQVFAYAAPTQAPAAQSYRERRDAQRAETFRVVGSGVTDSLSLRFSESNSGQRFALARFLFLED